MSFPAINAEIMEQGWRPLFCHVIVTTRLGPALDGTSVGASPIVQLKHPNAQKTMIRFLEFNDRPAGSLCATLKCDRPAENPHICYFCLQNLPQINEDKSLAHRLLRIHSCLLVR